MTGRDPVRKYILRMRNRKLRNILPSGALFTGSDSHMTVRGPVRPYLFPRTFFLVVVVQHVGWGASLQRPRTITIENYHPFYFHILGVLYDVRVL